MKCLDFPELFLRHWTICNNVRPPATILLTRKLNRWLRWKNHENIMNKEIMDDMEMRKPTLSSSLLLLVMEMQSWKRRNHKKNIVRQGMLHSGGELLLMLDADGVTKVTDVEKLEIQMFTRAAARKIFTNIRLKRRCFDVEIVYLCKRLNIPMTEVSVNWSEIPGSKVRLTSIYGLGIWKVFT